MRHGVQIMRKLAVVLTFLITVVACGGDDGGGEDLSCEELGQRLSDYATAAAMEFAETGELPQENPDEVELLHQFQDMECSPDSVRVDP